MTAFDLFQRATCQIAEGNRAAAIKTLDKAIAKIDRDGKHACVRGSLVSLRDDLSRTLAAAARARQMNAELPQATRDVLALKGMI